MTDWTVLASFSVCGALLAMMAISIAFSAFMPALDRWNRGYFVTFFSLLFLYVIVIVFDVIVYTVPALANMGSAVAIAEYLFFSVLTPMPIFFLLHKCGEEIRRSALLRAGLTLWGIFCVLLIAGRITDAFYGVAPDGQYVRRPLFPLLIAPLAAIMLLNIAGLIKRRKKLSKRIFIGLLVYLLPTALMIIVYMFVAADIVVALWMVLSALTMYGFIHADSVEQYTRQQREIARQRADIMVLQMRPHFICNTMMSIYYLCDRDPQKAKQVTLDFTDYLRRNFNAVSSENVIPFTDELEHARAYLAVEQAQFEDGLLVRFDTPHTAFRLPPLTLQPLVENAVKHGMKATGEPLHVYVTARQTDRGSEITVEDDGVGFSSAGDGAKPGALANIRQRLSQMCGGTLEIGPREGGGTRVKITLPGAE